MMIVAALVALLSILIAANVYVITIGPLSWPPTPPQHSPPPSSRLTHTRRSSAPSTRSTRTLPLPTANLKLRIDTLQQLDADLEAAIDSLQTQQKKQINQQEEEEEEQRFKSSDRPAEQLWSKQDDTGNDVARDRYRSEFQYAAPAKVFFSEERRSARAACEARLSADERFEMRFQTRYMEHTLRRDNATLMDAFAGELHAQQHPDDCTRARLLLYPQNQDCGIGAELHWMQMALTAAYESNRTLVMREDQGWTWAERALCGEKSFSCYFLPLSGCDVHNDAELNALLHDYAEWPPTVTTANYSAAHLASQRVLHWKNNGDFAFSRFMPARHKTRGRNLFWWRAMLTRYQFRVQPHVQQLADAAKQRIGAAPHQLGLHVRGGDKVHGNKYNRVETRLTTETATLFAQIELLAAECDIERVFVSTRDPAVIAELQRRQQASDSQQTPRFVWDNDELRYGNGFHTLDLLKRKLNVTEEALNAIKDLLILLDSDMFVGMMDSNYSRLVAELGMALRRFKTTPVASTKSDWIILP